MLNSIKFGGLGISAGVVWWALRSGSLIASLLASTPAWRHIDPLPILGGRRKADGEEKVDWGQAEDVNEQRDEQAAGWVLDSANT